MMNWDRPYNGVVYFKLEIKQFIFLMFILWVFYWLIYAVPSMCLPGLVNICVCLFNQKWLGTPAIDYLLSMILMSTSKSTLYIYVNHGTMNRTLDHFFFHVFYIKLVCFVDVIYILSCLLSW